MTDWGDDILSEDDADEHIIELMDIVEGEGDPETEDEIIELTDIVKHGSADLNLDIVGMETETIEETSEIEEIPLFDKGLDLEMEVSLDDLPVEPVANTVSDPSLHLSPEQIEASLERVIEKKFADKIEAILFEVMEKVIQKEIAEIKESLQKDLDQIGNV